MKRRHRPHGRAPVQRRDVLAPLVDAAVDHVAAYYEHKSHLADRDVVAALDPRWLNPLERTFLWGWGWKPALVFRFVDGAGAGSAERRALEDLRAATAAAERDVDRELAAVQESLAGPLVLAALRHQAPRNDEADEAVAAVGRSLCVLLGSVDALRERTVRGVSLHGGYLCELRELVGDEGAAPPQLFVVGRYVGCAAKDGRGCPGCGGTRFVPCWECGGSCKEVAGGEVERCGKCNENERAGLGR